MSTIVHRRGIVAALVPFVLASALPLGGCTIGEPGHSSAPIRHSEAAATATGDSRDHVTASDTTGTATEKSMGTAAPGTPESSAARTGASGAPAVLRGTTISLDPGHAGTPPPADIMVTDGRGGSKQCNTTGTAAADGWPEHTFNWELAQLIRAQLEDAGATVLLSRNDDTGRAPCIDERAETENTSAADVIISLHADGAGEGARGFHVSAIADPLPGNKAAESTALATAVRDALADAGFTPSNYLGVDGLHPRSDLTGLNLSTKPKVLVEYGNMRDSHDIALLQSDEGRERMAHATVEGIARYLTAAG